MAQERLLIILQEDKTKENNGKNTNNFFEMTKKINKNSGVKNLVNQ